MAITVVDKDNFQEFMAGGEIKPEPDEPKEPKKGAEKPEKASEDAKDEKKEAKAPEKVDSDADDLDLPEKARRAINKKHRAMREADEFAEEQYRERKAAEKRAEAAEARVTELESKGKPAPVEAKEPDPKDFTNDKGEFDAFGYAKALAKHSAEEAVKADRKEQEKLSREAAQERAHADYLKRVQVSAKGIEDWQEAAEEAADLKVSGPLTQYLYESTDAPAQLLYHFAKHPDVLERLNSLPAIKAIAEVAKLELSLTKVEPEKVEPEVRSTKSRAPEPIAPLGNGQGTVRRSIEDMTVKDHIEDEYRQAREASRQRKRH